MEPFSAIFFDKNLIRRRIWDNNFSPQITLKSNINFGSYTNTSNTSTKKADYDTKSVAKVWYQILLVFFLYWSFKALQAVNEKSCDNFTKLQLKSIRS